MNVQRFGLGAVALCVIFAATMAPSFTLAQEEYSGAFYVGDADGDGVIGPGDLNIIEQQITTGAAIYNTEPPDPDVQDLDGDAVVGPGDLATLEQWVTGNWATGNTGKPFEIVLAPAATPAPAGGSTTLCVEIYDNPGSGDMVSTPRAGWGVNFYIQSTDCVLAELYGLDPSPQIGLGKGQYITVPGDGATVFDYTSVIASGGQACVQVLATNCVDGDLINVLAYIPDDAEALFVVGSPGRFGVPLAAPSPIVVTPPGPCCSLSVTPDPLTLNDGDVSPLTATHVIDGDVTGAATWTSLTPAVCSVVGGVVTIIEGCADATCTIQADYLTASDTLDITVINDETTVSVVTLTCNDVFDGAPVPDCAAPVCELEAGCGPVACACSTTCIGGDCSGTERCDDATYTAQCDEGTASGTDTANILNNETVITSVAVTPAGPLGKGIGETEDFLCAAQYEPACPEDCDGPPTIWAISGAGACATSTIDSVGLYTADPLGGGGCTDEVTATYAFIVSNIVIITLSDPGLIVTPDPLTLNDGDVSPLTATHSVDGDVTAVATWMSLTPAVCSVVGGVVTINEGCADDVCTIQADYLAASDILDITVINDETTISIVSLACNPVNDGDAIDCAPTCQEEAICGPVACTCLPTCTVGCTMSITDEICYPTASGSYTALCDEGTASGSDTATVTNNEMAPLSVDLTPDGPNMVGDGESFPLACVADFSDGCVYNAVGADLSEGGGCAGSLSGMDYIGSWPPDCDEDVTCDVGGVPDTVTMENRGCVAMSPGIAMTWPLDGAARYSGNAHVDQVITIVWDGTGDDPTAASVTCAGGPAFTCDLSQIATDPDIPCAPAGIFADLTTYNCNVTLDNPCSGDTDSGALTTAQASAAIDGGAGAGYVGGLVYDSGAGGVGQGPVTITAVDAELNQPILGKVYVQIIQGGVIRERFTDPGTGTVTLDLDDAPIDELTLGYKCSRETCPKIEDGATTGEYRAANAGNYQYLTMHDVDASDIVARLPLMESARTNRWKWRVMGTIDEGYFSASIADRPTGIGGMATPTIRRIFSAPVRLRAAYVISTFQGIESLSSGLDALIISPDHEASISICILYYDNIDIPVKVSLPPNLLLPELRRADFGAGCVGWQTNPGVYQWEYHLYNPGAYENLWSIGAYINANNLSISGGIDLFSMPLYVCALGMRGSTVPGNLTGDPVQHVANVLGFQYDLREQWTHSTLGYDPDPAVDRKILVAMDGQLPIDPARRDATLRSGTYRVPNLTDSELGANWDKRFLRNHAVVASGADFGPDAGIGVTGLPMRALIDDADFTTFRVGYIQSSGSHMGTRDLGYWSSSSTDSEVVSAEQAGIDSDWVNPPLTSIDFTALEDGGPTNYAVVAVLTRGGVIDGRESDPGFSGGGLEFNFLPKGLAPGSIVSVWHVGPAQDPGNETIGVDEWLNVSEAVAPSPDDYIYPAPQWSNTIMGSNPVNRNGELWWVRTTGADDVIPTDPGDPWSRYYLEFTRPAFMHDAGRTIHMWQLALAEDDIITGDDGVSIVGMVDKISTKTKVYSRRGQTDATGTILNDASATFILQGVTVGDKLRSQTRKYRALCGWPVGTSHVITAVISETQLVVAGGICTGANATNFAYDVARQLPRGECLIDESFGGGPPDYYCKANKFWTAMGPADNAAQRVHVPQVFSGPRTLSGVTGFVPDLYDGMAPGAQLKWTRTFLVLGTQPPIQGGLGGPFDWNNWNVREDELAIQHVSSDSSKAIYQ